MEFSGRRRAAAVAAAALIALVVLPAGAAARLRSHHPQATSTPQLMNGLVVPKFQDVTQQAGVTTTVPATRTCRELLPQVQWSQRHIIRTTPRVWPGSDCA